MDSISHAVLGGSMQYAALGSIQKRKALFYGALLVTLPDLDVFIPHDDPISTMTIHRSFSHSIFTLTALAIGLTLLIRILRPNPAYYGRRLFIVIWLVLLSHPILDGLTIYGTQMFWPLQTTPISWGSISIIDPFFKLPLLIAFIWVLITPNSSKALWMTRLALIWAVFYLALGVFFRIQTEHKIAHYLETQGLEISKLKTSSLSITPFGWRTIALNRDGQTYYEILSSIFDKQAPDVLVHQLHPELASIAEQSPYYQRLKWFTGDWVRLDQSGQNLIVSDLRMGLANELMFSFVIALQDNDSWQVIKPETWYDPMSGDATENFLWGFRRSLLLAVPSLVDRPDTPKQSK